MYESLPWLYVAAGLVALGAGYRLRTGPVATGISLAGLGGVIGGVAVWLRRRDHRARSAAYPHEDDAPRS